MNYKYIEHLHTKFAFTDEAKSLFQKITKTPTEKREDILKDMDTLVRIAGWSTALTALYRQQVNNGFVLSDPLKLRHKTTKEFYDPDTGITFRFQWNPDRELRKDHRHLTERGVIALHGDETRFVNRDNKGIPCYLCKANIDTQNPGEILLAIELSEKTYYLGANFASLTNNHFTIMSAKHKSQRYHGDIPRILNDFVDLTEGHFRTLFNGLAGASIEGHEHLQATTEELPVERIRIEDKDVIYQRDDISVLRPKYYVPLWLVEGQNKTKGAIAADRIIRAWHSLNAQNHTVNIISSKFEDVFRIFVILRDKRKLSARGKKGAMGVFETGGNIVLSYGPTDGEKEQINEEHTFEKASLETIKELLKEISPEERSCSLLADVIS